jgi:hypothetical protein
MGNFLTENPSDRVSQFADLMSTDALARLEIPDISGYSAIDLLRTWQWCSSALDGKAAMMAQEYINCLSCRDRIEKLSLDMPAEAEASFRELVDDLDQQFLQATVDDGGVAISAYFAVGDRTVNMWWRRHPSITPKGW